jgi:KDO2-lipid IV(A) lauroyltransferase
MTRFIQSIIYYPLYVLILIFTNLPLKIQYVFSDISFIILYFIARYRRDVVKRNLEKSFPEKTEAERKIIARKYYRHLCDYFIESIALQGMNEAEIKKRFVYKNIEIINDLYVKGKGIILAVGHYNNWEWFGGMPFKMKHQLLGLYKPLNNPYFNRLFIQLREKFGGHAIPIAVSIKRMLEYHNKKIPTITLFLTDQRPVAEHIEYWTTFMNQDTPVQLGTEKIGKKLDYAIVYGHVRKIRRGYYSAEFTLLSEYPKETAEFEITEMHTRALEKTIREQPEYWLWSHRRWKHSRASVEERKKAYEASKHIIMDIK